MEGGELMEVRTFTYEKNDCQDGIDAILVSVSGKAKPTLF